MSEELLNLLARVPGLQVASRTSSFAYKGRNVDIREVGSQLGVDTVLEGSVRQAGDQVRITAQLIDTETGFHLWSETYDRQLADIFQVQDEIAGAIVSKLRIQLAPEDQQLAQRTRAPTQNVEAYELYLQGRAVWKKRGEANLKRAIELYQSALARDPAFARAHAALASAYVVMAGYTKEQGDEKKFNPLAETSARQALVLEPNIGEAHAVLAQINADRGDFLDAESGFFFAISLEPNEPTPHHWYSILLSRVGRLQAALTQARRAYELDPSSPILAANLGNMLLQLGQDDEALRFVSLASELGLSKKEYGVQATVAIRRGDWVDARRLMGEIENIPDEIKPEAQRFVDALADPKLRPEIVAGMRAIDPKIAPQVFLSALTSSWARSISSFASSTRNCARTPIPGSPTGISVMSGPRRAAVSAPTSASDRWPSESGWSTTGSSTDTPTAAAPAPTPSWSAASTSLAPAPCDGPVGTMQTGPESRSLPACRHGRSDGH